MNRWVVIVAAGKGSRTGFDENKVLVNIRGTCALSMCLSVFKDSGLFTGAVIVSSKKDYARIKSEFASDFVRDIVIGGETRQESVFNGLKSVSSRLKSVITDADIVAIHDAARPFVTREICEATIQSAEKYGSGVSVSRVTDTIKVERDDGGVDTPQRDKLWAAQTPQTFRLDEIVAAHEKAQKDNFSATDDAALYEKYHGGVRLIYTPDSEKNIKMTTKSDFMRLVGLSRIGHGFDAHRLVEGRKLILCGEQIEYPRGLDGHSDADVAIHALIDAMLGAAALGDIGKLFPDSDERYRGISSILLLKETNERLRSCSWQVSNADITIIAQKPKLAAYIDGMRGNIANALGIPIESVSVKATTTEGMGFEGAGEGISAHSVVLISGRMS